jgi:hypothetical protein
MPIQTDTSVSPYFDDYSEQKDYYKVLFRPGVAVQARELNQLQSILQNQIERFGNNIFKQGTIVDGCDITFHSSLRYVKIRDVEVSAESEAVDVNRYKGYRVKNQQNNLEAAIITATPGFESTAPNLNTLYIRYLNTGASNQATFGVSEQLTVFDPVIPIEKITIDQDGGSTGFVSTDRVVILSAITVANAAAAGFTAGSYVTNGIANVQIIDIVNNNTLRIAPYATDLKSGDVTKWTFTVDTPVQASANVQTSIVSIIGSGASASITTAGTGTVTSISIANRGSGYTIPPTISIASPNASIAQIQGFSATPQTELAKITVASSSLPTGNSYAMTVGEGVIYQKGYFSRVAEQLVIIEKYNNVPNDISVGFETQEEVINSNQDDSLLDNATGAPNYTAPGANRLKLTPKLTVISKAEADAREDWLYVAEFSNGNPYKQNRQTVYNVIGKEMNRRFNETAGSYVTNQFLLQTKNTPSFADEATKFNVLIDPGVAFINGARVETLLNYEAPINKGTSTQQVTNGNISLNYGNYVKVNEVGGYFLFQTGDRVSLYDTAKGYITNNVTRTPTTAGSLIGTARIRSVVYDSGVPGTASCVYRLYLFDINMNIGKNFSDVRSIFYDGVDNKRKAVCDTVLENGNAVIKDNINSSLLYYAGNPAIVNASSIGYIYRTSRADTETQLINNENNFTIGLGDNETFPYSGGPLSSTQLRDIIVIPLANSQSSSVKTGTVVANTTSNTVTGTGTKFVSEYRVGDYIRFDHPVGDSAFGQISSIANDTIMFITSIPTFTVAANTHRLYYPAFSPIDLDRPGRGATVTPDGQQQLTVTIDRLIIDGEFAITYNVRQSNIIPVTKTVNRNRYVRLCMANNVQANTGPWPLGVADAFRLKKVYRGANATFGSSGSVDVTQNFYIDHNQTEDYYGISYLYQKPGTNLGLTSSDWLLVQFDHFSATAEGLKAPGSSPTYSINDAATLNAIGGTINTVEIPEVYGARGTYYDLRDQFDFRPVSSTTATPSTDFLIAPLNPLDQGSATRFSTADKKFPAPDSELSATINYYVGRSDRVIIDESAQFRVISGTPGSNEPPAAPENALSINVLKIPPYPSLPYQLSTEMIEFIDTKIANEKYGTRRINDYRVTTAQTDKDRANIQPRGYTMVDIGKLERRIQDLEYYTALTLTELQAQKRPLPGFDGADRFKFGFFVDSFENYTYSDTSNPAYAASIVDGYLSPFVRELNIEMRSATGDDGVLPYIEENYITQTRATDGPLVANTVETVTQIITSVIQEQRNRSNSDSGNVYEEFFYQFSTKTGPVEFYINARDNGVAVEFSQSDTPDGPWTTTIASSVLTANSQSAGGGITRNDITAKGLSRLNGGRQIEKLGSLQRREGIPAGTSWGPFIKDQFKLLYTYDPASGVYVRVRVYKGKKVGGFLQNSKSGTFGYKLFYPTDTTINQTQITQTTNFGLNYNGFVIPNNTLTDLV